jgi:hypothetical protein
MIRIATLCALVASVSLSAQTTPAPTPSITVTGCVAQVQRDGSMGAKPTGTQATPETAAIEANNPEPTNRYQLIDATPVAGDTKNLKTTYGLRGQENELAKHAGHRIQITGSLMPSPAAKLPSKTAATADGTRTVQVTAIKMIATNCSASEPAR